ncbi:NF-kappa-B inhibitor 1 isoform A [Chlorella sorokiniana]|uniref:NF-kappa-B inhibitor-like protein 1 n=1 Tax=Chlorella sorokiniana TaxID=3076 RepID=A0A2P6TV02_CHLSO|nr:NF-kappa-B inhibitor 1 isoform A [Chlorella sorokiniana]|eukprot:PRW57890.1 NF-kappa-B inhibitor 1 isoform A [Chlorella sorokiniana]
MAKEKRSKKERRRDGKHKRKKRRRSSSRSSSGSGGSGRAPSPRRLLLAAALGDKHECRELIQQGADVAYADAEGTTALHEACRHGHLSTAKLLLRRGADAGLGDVRGDTAAHLAAKHGHLDVLAALLQADNPPEIEAVNGRGQSVAQLAAQAMDKQDVQSYRREAAEQEQEWQGERQRERSPSLGPDSWDWQQRLQNEMSMDQSEDDPWGAYSGGDWHADEYETPEEYARRIWDEMQAHRRSKEQAERAAFTQRRRQEEAQRQAFREHAEAASRRILEDQKKQDAEWRAAVAEGQAGTKRARAEAAWQFFASKHPESIVHYADVPWILPAKEPKQEELQRVVLYGTSGPEEQRRRLRTELVRWHPDKFVARFGRRLAAEDRDRILARVARTAQQLNAISAALPK